MKVVKRLILFLFLPLLLLLALLYTQQQRIIFPATQLEEQYQYNLGNNAQELFITTNDSIKLNAIHFTKPNPQGVIIYYHGNAGDLSRWIELVKPLLAFNYELLIMDYRGYGKSQGEPSSEKMYEDALLFYDHARTMFPEDKIVLYGRSFGTTLATYVASQRKAKQLILETPFYSLSEVVESRFFPFLTLFLKYHFPTNEFAKGVKCPTLIIHGTLDEVVPYESGVKLKQGIPNSQLVTIEGGRHNDLVEFDAYHRAIEQLLAN